MDNQDNAGVAVPLGNPGLPKLKQAQFIPGIIKPWMLAVQQKAALGDTFYSNGESFITLAIGSSGQVLTVANGVPAWTAPVQVFTQLKNQAIAANTTYTNGITIQSGWSYFTGTGATPLIQAITYPTAFTTLLMPPVLGLLGGKNGGGAPTAITDFTVDWGVTQALIAKSPTLSGFTAYNFIATLGAGTYNGFSWIAMGTI